jgi:uncharacterized damage-inducible protein DinB
MSTIAVLSKTFKFNRTRTLATLEEIEKLAHPEAALAFRLGPGRAHIGWQFMHIGVTEEIFATERLLPEKPGRFSDLWPRFRGGSRADDDVPSPAAIRQVLESSRATLLETLTKFSDEQLGDIPPALAEKKWTLRDVLFIVGWHEAHHQGQAHIMLNSFRASQL